MDLNLLARAGGLFAVLTFVHFFADWIFQTHYEAMRKHNHPWIRARHCTVYTVFFLPVLWLMGIHGAAFGVACAVLWVSHFAEDTYIPVYLWALYIRRAVKTKEEFVTFVDTALGKILMIAVDQIIHLSFLWIIVYLALRNA